MENNIIQFRAMKKPMYAQLLPAQNNKAAGYAGSGYPGETLVGAAGWSYSKDEDIFFWKDDEATLRFLEQFNDDEVICVENKLIQLVTGGRKRF